MRKAPILNVLFGAGATAEALARAYSGDLEAATHSLIAAGYNFVSGLGPYLPTLEKLQNSDKPYVNGIGAAANIIFGILDTSVKHLIPDYNSAGDRINNQAANKNTRSISYATLPMQQLIALGSNALEAYERM